MTVDVMGSALSNSSNIFKHTRLDRFLGVRPDGSMLLRTMIYMLSLDYGLEIDGYDEPICLPETISRRDDVNTGSVNVGISYKGSNYITDLDVNLILSIEDIDGGIKVNLLSGSEILRPATRTEDMEYVPQEVSYRDGKRQILSSYRKIKRLLYKAITTDKLSQASRKSYISSFNVFQTDVSRKSRDILGKINIDREILSYSGSDIDYTVGHKSVLITNYCSTFEHCGALYRTAKDIDLDKIVKVNCDNVHVDCGNGKYTIVKIRKIEPITITVLSDKGLEKITLTPRKPVDVDLATVNEITEI